jgi:hypothetical protein
MHAYLLVGATLKLLRVPFLSSMAGKVVSVFLLKKSAKGHFIFNTQME